MKLRSGYEGKKARVEMLPLIDVVFLLLVFFIYAMLSMVVQHGLKISLPTAETAVTERNEMLTITVNAENKLFLNGEAMEAEAIAHRVLSERREKPMPVLIEGDQKADLGVAIGLLDRLKKAGIEEVSFSCQKENP
jgi:biopolymer transport protein ExbD